MNVAADEAKQGTPTKGCTSKRGSRMRHGCGGTSLTVSRTALRPSNVRSHAGSSTYECRQDCGLRHTTNARVSSPTFWRYRARASPGTSPESKSWLSEDPSRVYSASRRKVSTAHPHAGRSVETCCPTGAYRRSAHPRWDDHIPERGAPLGWAREPAGSDRPVWGGPDANSSMSPPGPSRENPISRRAIMCSPGCPLRRSLP